MHNTNTLRCSKCGGKWFSCEENGDIGCMYCGQRVYQQRLVTLLPGTSTPCPLALTPDELSHLAMRARAAETEIGTYVRCHLHRPVGPTAPAPAQPEVVVQVGLTWDDWRYLRKLGGRRDWPLPLVLRAIALDVLAEEERHEQVDRVGGPSGDGRP